MKGWLKNFWIFLFFLTLPALTGAQSYNPEISASGTIQTAEQVQSRLMAGINLFGQGKFHEAVLELRRVQADAPVKELRAEALFWISLSELSAGEYEEALWDMYALEEADPGSFRIKELPYHKARSLYYLGRFDEAIILFKGYADSILPADGMVLNPADESRKSAAYYWTGECLYSMGQLDKAGEFFRLIVEIYPGSPKYEASQYRLAMINQKKVETELLNLLQWSHEESLRNMEEFRRRESAYDQALSAYQKRIADMTNDTRLRELEETNTYFREQLILAEERIRSLENTLMETSSAIERAKESTLMERLKSMRDMAQEIENLIRENNR